MKQLLIATENPGKFQEIVTMFQYLPLKLLSLRDVGISLPASLEDGSTFEENAYTKAHYCAVKAKYMSLADDSGLIVDVLKGELGIKTRRWGAGEKASDEEWLQYFMKRMEKETNRNATFVSCACLVDKSSKILFTAQGETPGIITKNIAAPIKPGVPLSSVFIPDGCSKVHSALTLEEKNKISHRGKAMIQIKEFLKIYLNN